VPAAAALLAAQARSRASGRYDRSLKLTRYLAPGPLLAIGLIVVAVVPWWSFRDHSHWAKVEWIPFTGPVLVARDFFANVALFIPLGIVIARRSVPTRRIFNAAMIAAGISILAELTQVYSHSRFPTATDVVANVVGAAAAAALVSRRE
jgi:glycopeptide antibiotics resistance protein